MHFKKLNCGIQFFVFLLMIFNINVYGQTNSSKKEEKVTPLIDTETYQEVLDILFPRDTIASLPYGFVLRFKPSFNAESQITVNNNFGNIEVVEYNSPDGNIREQLNKMLEQTEDGDAEELSKRIRISRRVLNVPPSITKRWREDFYKRLALAGSYENKLIKENMRAVPQADDGTSYLLWYKGNSDFSFQFNGGSEPDSSLDPNDSPLVNWMKQFKKEVSKLPTANEQSNKTNGANK